MTQDELEECRWRLLYSAEYSSRYHRRRAAFLTNLDTFLTLLTVVAGASAFGDLVAGSPTWLSKVGAATVTIISLVQVVLRLGSAGTVHAQWLKRWNRLNASISLNTTPTAADVAQWTSERAAIEEECVAELRALTLDCEDAAARVLEIPGRQHRIHPVQRFLIHFGTFQQTFPYMPDTSPPVADQTASTP
ncbi:hypothetical protein [Sphingomonas sp. PB4P5]|uniref:hypothetical protein n=1 Tax=Parasphingomonas puruogangriensis TaxID=3096155 RepID=UPI002FC9A188